MLARDRIGIGSLSLLLALWSVLWILNIFDFSLGDSVLDFIGLMVWTEGNVRTRLTVYYSLLFFVPAIFLGIRYRNDFGARIGRIISITGTVVILLTLLIVIV